jgi:hypothetical protein
MEIVSLTSYSSGPEAHMAKNLLESEGIRAFLSEDITGDMLHLTNDIRLMVAETDVEKARAILEGAERHEFTAEAAAEAEEHAGDKPADE